MEDYKKIKGGTLKIKGKSIFKSDRPKKAKSDASTSNSAKDTEAAKHGGWWRIAESELKGGIPVAIQADVEGAAGVSYLMAMDNGQFTLGPPHFEGEGPNPEEVLALVKAPDDDKISLKTGYGKYVGVDAEGRLVGQADAIGTRERFMLVFQDGKCALQAVVSSMFLSLEPNKDGHVFCGSRQAKESEMLVVRSNEKPAGPADFRTKEDKLNARECETAYIKMYQHSKVDLKNRNVTVNLRNREEVFKAQRGGNLHEELLNRRAATKSDKYC